MMDWRHGAAVVSGLIALASFPPYIRGMLWGTVRPNRAAWWSVTFIMGSLSFNAWWDGATATAVLPGLLTVGDLAVSILAVRYGVGGLGRLDLTCILLVGVSLAAAWLTSAPLVAVAGAMTAHLASNIPTVTKAWADPRSESQSAWTLLFVSALINLAAADLADLAHWAHPVSGLVVCSTMMFAVNRPSDW